ncbi:hypothetical protein DFQ26_008158 [Actinomortierella ambigua]|nr:hypothetical protein DFQ26_008158 [Actinomortierella ambigua]
MATSPSDHVAQRHRLFHRCLTAAAARRRFLLRSITLGAMVLTPLTVVEGIQCTSPSYPAVYKAGSRQEVSWKLDSADLQAAKTRLSAYIYCMDRAGPNGGMWRQVDTLFDLKPVEFGPSVAFTVPPCGINYGGGDGAVRVVSWRYDDWGMGSQETQCRYQIMAAASEPNPPSPPTTVPPKPTPPKTTDKLEPPIPTVGPPVSTQIPNPPTVPPPPPQSTTQTTQPASMGGRTTSIVTPGYTPTNNGPGAVSPSDVPLPPLPPMPPMPDGPTGVGPQDDEQNRRAFIQSLVGGLSGVGVVVVIVALVLRQRRRRHRDSPSTASSRGDLNGPSDGLRAMKGRLRGKTDPNSRFHRMEDEDDEGDDHRGGASGSTGGDCHFNESEKMMAVANFNNSRGNKLSILTTAQDPEKSAMALKRQSGSVRIPVNLMDMEVDGSMQMPLTPTTTAYRVSLGPALPSLIKPPALAHVGSDVALSDAQKWSMLLTQGRRQSYTSSRDDYSFMQQGYLDDFAEQEDDSSIRHAAALRPGEMARRDSQMMQSLGSSGVGLEDSDLFLSGSGRGVGGRGSSGASIVSEDMDDVASVGTEDASSVVKRYWAAGTAARAERVEERRRELAREQLERRQGTRPAGGNGGAGPINSSSDSVATARPPPRPPRAVGVPSKSTAALNLTSETLIGSCPTVGVDAHSRTSTMLLREDWESTDSKMADQGSSRVGTLTTHWTTGTSSSRRRSSATTGASLSTGSRRASSMMSADHLHYRMMMHPLYPRQPRPSSGERPLQQRQRLGRSASISSSFTLSSFGSSGRNTRLYSYTHGAGAYHHHHLHPTDNPNGRPFLHPLEPLPPTAYYPSHYHHPEDPFQDSASAYAYTLDEDGTSSQAPTHLSIVSSSVDSSAVLATDPFKTFDSNNLIED